MKKRILSMLFSIIICAGIIPNGFITAQAASYADELRRAGFTEEYIAPLVELHNKYPNWTFQALQTNLSLDEAAANERTPHSQQNIQKTNSNAANGYYCDCSKCYVNGEYKITEGKSWVAASEKAVKYYLNPLNFLDEKYIFQFESTAYNSAHNQDGVEAIIKGTWMQKAHIQYLDSNGVNHWYDPPHGKYYSEAIMEAAKQSGLSAYYLASKIMQEVGGAKPTAGGASGSYSGYEGIYNYYNIGANTGAKDGLKWASLNASGYVTNCACKVRKGPSTSTTHLVTLPTGTKVNYKGATSKQSDGYVWYSISVTYNGKNYDGYIRSDLINYNSNDKYNRPWTNPYLSIINGAKWIANNYTSTQSTGYLQKFNVNPASKNRFEHEYMANVQGAASEAAIQYNAYKKANILSAPKTFLIPIYSGLTGTPIDLDYVDKNTFTVDVTGTSALIKWKAVDKAQGYEIRLLSSPHGEWTVAGRTNTNSYFLKGLTTTHNYSIQIRAYAKSGSTTYYSPGWSYSFGFRTMKFDDIGDYPGYEEYLNYTSINNDFIMGTNPPEYTHFSPAEALTRGMFITILYRMAGEPYKNNNPHNETPFDDIDDVEAYYYDAACWALDKKITTETHFAPENAVTREQTAAFLYRYTDMIGKIDSRYRNTDLSKFPDSNNISEWAVEPIRWANYENMITGTMQGYIYPKNATRRIHAAKILCGFGKTCGIGNL